MAETETVDHRIGVGQRPQQQGEQGIDDQKRQDREQQRDPKTRHQAPAHALTAAARDLGAPGRLSVQSVLPLAGDRLALFLCGEPSRWRGRREVVRKSVGAAIVEPAG